MLKHIRLATKEEVENLRATSNYGPKCVLYAMDQNEGPDFGLVSEVIELDPVTFGKGTNDVQKAKFIWGLEERMAGAGIPQYFFNVAASDERWQKVIKTWGAEQVSPGPELRFLKRLS